jgi:hypothetical protein
MPESVGAPGRIAREKASLIVPGWDHQTSAYSQRLSGGIAKIPLS